MYKDNTKLHTIKEYHRQEEDDKEAATVIATVATGEGNNYVGSIPILPVLLVCQRRNRNQINDIKLM